MSVIYSSAAKDDRMESLNTLLANGKLELLESSTIIATYTLTATPIASTGGVATISLAANTVAAGASTVGSGLDGARFRTSGNVDVITGLTVGTAATDIIIDNTDVNTGQNITLSSVQITHGA
jgi:hypothetical protein